MSQILQKLIEYRKLLNEIKFYLIDNRLQAVFDRQSGTIAHIDRLLDAIAKVQSKDGE